MVDKIISVAKAKIGKRVGRLDDDELLGLNEIVMIFLRLAVSPRTTVEQ
jgi:mRNA interferase MazF